MSVGEILIRDFLREFPKHSFSRDEEDRLAEMIDEDWRWKRSAGRFAPDPDAPRPFSKPNLKVVK